VSGNAGTRATNQLVRKLRKQGFTVTLGGGGHWRCTHPDREGLVFFSASPQRAHFPKTLKMLKAMGFKP